MFDGAHSSDLRNLDPVRLAVLRLLSGTVLGGYGALLGDRLRVGEGVVANHRLIIKGPGRVRLDDGANLFAFGAGRRTRLITRTPGATIRIGENARLNGADIQAAELVEIGPDCIVGQAHLLDTDMHSLALDRRTNPDAPVRTEPIVLEGNVWVARGAAIRPGVRIGEGSVVAYGSVVTTDVPPAVLVAGNPATVIRSLS
jgi:acetyltransferase-like isoleucine patch superfamily enzyme